MNRLHLDRAWLSRTAAAAALAAAGVLVAGCHPGSSSSTASGGKSGAPASHSSSPKSGSHTSAPGGSGGSGGSGDALFPAAVGDTWTYRESLAGSNGTTINKVTAVTPDSGGQKVTINTSLNGGSTTNLTYQLNSDGSIGVPYADAGDQHVIVKSGSIVWPSKAVLDSGQPHTSPLKLQINAAGHTINVSAQVTVQGLGTHSVTVPAGTYQATLVSETIAETFSGTRFHIVVKTWLAPGVGPVKSAVDTGTGTATTEVLTSFKKG